MPIKYIIFAFSFCVSFQCAYAEEGHGAEPPQEIYDACKDLKAGDPCSYFDQFNHKLSGKCTKDQRVTVCIVDDSKKKEE